MSDRFISGILFQTNLLDPDSIIYLGSASQHSSSYLPTGIGRAALTTGIFGIATHKVYPYNMSPHCSVGSYPTFSPLPRKAVIFCGTRCFYLKIEPSCQEVWCSELSRLSSLFYRQAHKTQRQNNLPDSGKINEITIEGIFKMLIQKIEQLSKLRFLLFVVPKQLSSLLGCSIFFLRVHFCVLLVLSVQYLSFFFCGICD